MEEKYSIGIIGAGYVGKAVYHGFSLNADIKIHDKIPELATSSLEDTVNSDFIYICLPTPMTKVDGGEIDLRTIDGVLEKINNIVKRNR